MPQQVIIDGNNLLHAMHAHAPVPSVGRETLLRIVERWARGGDDDVTIVFDGPQPRGGMAKQMTSSRVAVRFSAPATADDIIVALIARAADPASARVVSSDRAVQREAGYRRCLRTDSAAFVAELFRETRPSGNPARSERTAGPAAKPPPPTPDETDRWMAEFGLEPGDGEPFDGADAMGS